MIPALVLATWVMLNWTKASPVPHHYLAVRVSAAFPGGQPAALYRFHDLVRDSIPSLTVRDTFLTSLSEDPAVLAGGGWAYRIIPIVRRTVNGVLVDQETPPSNYALTAIVPDSAAYRDISAGHTVEDDGITRRDLAWPQRNHWKPGLWQVAFQRLGPDSSLFAPILYPCVLGRGPIVRDSELATFKHNRCCEPGKVVCE